MESEARFWSYVQKTKDCWLWTGYTRKGYGSFWTNGHNIGAHRWSYQHHYKIDPGELCVCHHCDNPRCVNPAHLFLGTRHDNALDMAKKGRANSGSKSPFKPGEANPSAKLSSIEVCEIRRLYQAGGISQRQLARQFGVAYATIFDIIHRRKWKHI